MLGGDSCMYVDKIEKRDFRYGLLKKTLCKECCLLSGSLGLEMMGE